MTVIQYVERNFASAKIKAIYKWIQKKVDITQDYRFTESEDEKITENKYSPKYIVRLISEKDRNRKIFFYFRNMNDYITLSSNGQLNARCREEDMFKPWGSSEFRNLKPYAIFQELEYKIIKINVISVSGRKDYSFNSYSEFINWLDYRENLRI